MTSSSKHPETRLAGRSGVTLAIAPRPKRQLSSRGSLPGRLPPFHENRKAPIDLQRQPRKREHPRFWGTPRPLRVPAGACVRAGAAAVAARRSGRGVRIAPVTAKNVRTPHTRGRRPCRRRASAVAHVVTAASGSGSAKKVSLRLQPRACGSGALGLSSRNAQPTTGLSGRTHSCRGTVVSWRLEASRVSSRR